MTIAVFTHESFLAHEPGVGHPERPDRLRAVRHGISAAGLEECVRLLMPEPASRSQLLAVHAESMVASVEALGAAGGGQIDADTVMNEASLQASKLAAGAGLTAIDVLAEGTDSAAFCAVRPPGHHATPHQSMGFCVFNSIAVTATALAEAGHRVAIVDVDAHHGNGTQDAFYDDPRVLFASIHQSPLYPGTGRFDEVGEGAAVGSTLNIPVPSGSTGDVYRKAVTELIVPALERHDADHLLISAGFDSHRDDPLTDLGLSSADQADVIAEVVGNVDAPPVIFLEGGYDLEALANGVGATLGALSGVSFRPEPPTAGGPGGEVVDAIVEFRSTLQR